MILILGYTSQTTYNSTDDKSKDQEWFQKFWGVC